MLRNCYSLIVVLLFTTSLQAQKYFINGYVKDSITHFPISNSKILNAGSKKTTYTDYTGFFRMEVAPDEIIQASAAEYHAATITYSTLFTDTIIIYLSSSGKILPTVTITSSYTKYQLDSIDRKKTFEGARGNHLSKISRADGFGITLSLDKIFKEKYKYQRKNEKRFSAMEKAAYVQYRFPPQMVAFYTGLKGLELQQFMNQHTPTYQWLRQHLTNDEVLFYISDQLKLYKAKK